MNKKYSIVVIDLFLLSIKLLDFTFDFNFLSADNREINSPNSNTPGSTGKSIDQCKYNQNIKITGFNFV